MPEQNQHSNPLVQIIRHALYRGHQVDSESWDWQPADTALTDLEEQLETTQRILVEERRWREETRAALDAIVNAKSFVNSGGYAVTGDEAQELAIKRAADLVSNPASSPQTMPMHVHDLGHTTVGADTDPAKERS